MVTKRRKFWGWGVEGEGPSLEQQRAIAASLAARFDCAPRAPLPAPKIGELVLPTPRISPPPSLEAICSSSPFDRAGHSYGKSFRDIVRGLSRDFQNPPDLVAFPRHEKDLVDLLDWCSATRAAVVPYGGGSSVTGGVEPPRDDGYVATVSVDLKRLDKVLEVDECSRAARIQAGVYGPALEDHLRPYGLTLRHFPQSFEFSTLGGWIATRSGGHYATLYTHIDDFVESLRVVSPAGVAESRRLPGSGAGPSPDRAFVGSEGALGIITEAWMRLQTRPTFRSSAAVRFADYQAAVEAVRVISQAGLYPTNLRLLDADEALVNGVGDGTAQVLIIGFESADHELGAWMERALECCLDFGGVFPEGAGLTRKDGEGGREGATEAWRKAFLQAPYLRDTLVAMGFVTETFETAVTWDRFEDFHAGVMEETRRALDEVCGGGLVTCRFTHAYPDGPAPYFSVIAPGRFSSLLAQWSEIKHAAAEAVIRLGGTITHHHGVGRDHMPWYERQRSELYGEALLAAKMSLDPAGVMNPGVLLKVS
ncbi:MAG: FAD-binding oxidoreductase [Candidatus Binatia bacterium]